MCFGGCPGSASDIYSKELKRDNGTEVTCVGFFFKGVGIRPPQKYVKLCMNIFTIFFIVFKTEKYTIRNFKIYVYSILRYDRKRDSKMTVSIHNFRMESSFLKDFFFEEQFVILDAKLHVIPLH